MTVLMSNLYTQALEWSKEKIVPFVAQATVLSTSLVLINQVGHVLRGDPLSNAIAQKKRDDTRDAEVLSKMRHEPDDIRNLTPKRCRQFRLDADAAIHRLEMQAELPSERVKEYHELFANTVGHCLKNCPNDPKSKV